MEEDRRFLCFWSAGMYPDSGFKVKPFDFFTEDRGYTPEDIEAIDQLDIHFDHITDIGFHIIIRIK